MVSRAGKKGVFVGLTTLDMVYLCDRLPTSNEKRVALDALTAAGGPATNAAVAFQHLGQSTGDRAGLLSGLGNHPLAQLVRQDLAQYGVEIIDLTPDQTAAPAASSILVTQSTGDRAVISRNAVGHQAALDGPGLNPEKILSDAAVILIDGHQMAAGAVLAKAARQRQIPVVVDGGSWKPNFETVLRQTTYGIASANFYPPGCATQAETAAFLQNLGISYIAITQGADPVCWWTKTAQGKISVLPVAVVDTLGAGDIFHGAFCHALAHLPAFSQATTEGFLAALEQAATVAAIACQSFGTRAWLAQTGSNRF